MVGRLFCLFDLWLYFGLYLGFAQVVGWIGKSLPAIASPTNHPPFTFIRPELLSPLPFCPLLGLDTIPFIIHYRHCSFSISSLWLYYTSSISCCRCCYYCNTSNTCCGLQLRNCCNNNNKTDISNRAAFNLINFIALAANKSFTFCSYPISYLYSSQFLSCTEWPSQINLLTIAQMVIERK